METSAPALPEPTVPPPHPSSLPRPPSHLGRHLGCGVLLPGQPVAPFAAQILPPGEQQRQGRHHLLFLLHPRLGEEGPLSHPCPHPAGQGGMVWVNRARTFPLSKLTRASASPFCVLDNWESNRPTFLADKTQLQGALGPTAPFPACPSQSPAHPPLPTDIPGLPGLPGATKRCPGPLQALPGRGRRGPDLPLPTIRHQPGQHAHHWPTRPELRLLLPVPLSEHPEGPPPCHDARQLESLIYTNKDRILPPEGFQKTALCPLMSLPLQSLKRPGVSLRGGGASVAGPISIPPPRLSI